MSGLWRLRARPTPETVPPVPKVATRMSIRPSVSRRISLAVVASWMAGLAGFSNCWGMKAEGSCEASSAAFSIAPVIPFAPSVSTSSAPSAASSARRSRLIVSGIVRMRR